MESNRCQPTGTMDLHGKGSAVERLKIRRTESAPEFKSAANTRGPVGSNINRPLGRWSKIKTNLDRLCNEKNNDGNRAACPVPLVERESVHDVTETYRTHICRTAIIAA